MCVPFVWNRIRVKQRSTIVYKVQLCVLLECVCMCVFVLLHLCVYVWLSVCVCLFVVF